MPNLTELRKSGNKELKAASVQDYKYGFVTPIDAETAPRAIAAGADVLVAGTATFRGGPDKYAENIAGLRGE